MKVKLYSVLFALALAVVGIFAQAMPAGAMTQVLVGGYSDALNATTDEYNALQSGYTWTTTTTGRVSVCPTSGAISSLYVELSGVPGTNPYVFTVYLNGAPTSLTCSVAAGVTTASDTAHSVDVVAGDTLLLCSTTPDGDPANTPTARWSTIFTGSTANESVLMGGGYCNKSTLYYNSITAGNYAYTSSDDAGVIIPTDGYLKYIYVVLSADAGTDPDAYRMTVTNTTDTTSYAVTITADATTGNNNASTCDVSPGDEVYIETNPRNSPSASVTARWGVVFTADTNGESLILGHSYGNPLSLTTNYHYPQSSGGVEWTSSEGYQGTQDPTGDMVISDLWVQNRRAVGAAPDAWNFTVRSDGGDTTLTVQFQNTAADAQVSDTTHSFTCTSFGELSLKAVNTDSATAALFGWGMVCYINPSSFDISNSPSSEALGLVAINTTYYAFGSAPSNPVADGECTFTLTNNGSSAIDLDMKVGDFTGGVGWNIDATPAANEVKITCYYSGQDPSAGLVLTNADQEFYDALAASAHIHWDFALLTGSSFTDGTAKTATLTITAVAED